MPASLQTAALSQPDARLARQLPFLRERLERLYGARPGFASWFDKLIGHILQLAHERPAELRALDQQRLAAPGWFLSSHMVAYTAYVDRFAGNLQGVASRVPMLRELGVTYLHLLPFLKARSGANDGGFAVASYDEIEPRLGSMDDLQALTARLRDAGISLCGDFVLNHVSDDHPWAQGAAAGDARLRGFFHVFPDAEHTHLYEGHLGEVFPQTAPGNFTHVDAMGGHVWTTFYPYQWDLNYANPEVFTEMALALLRLANRGIEVFRLDSVAYLWKRAGTPCMNLPEVHWILQALRAVMAIAAPGVLLKAEAIVPTRELPPYFGEADGRDRECHLAYHSSLMSAAWLSVAEQDTGLLREVIAGTLMLPGQASWMTYVRCHDDIGWKVLRPELESAGDEADTRLSFASSFFEGRTNGSYARGEAFQAHTSGSAHGTNGMTSALVGVAAAQTPAEMELAVRRFLLLYALAFSVGGIPLIYMGDEIGLGNTPPEVLAAGAVDGRDLHRPAFDAAAWARRHEAGTVEAMVHSGFLRMLKLRRELAGLGADTPARVLPVASGGVLGIARGDRFMAFSNFTGLPQQVTLAQADLDDAALWADVLGGQLQGRTLTLQPWASAWLARGD